MNPPTEHASYSLPSPRDLLLSSSHEQQQEQSKPKSPVDSMMVDDMDDIPSLSTSDKPQLPSITNMQSYSPIPHSSTTNPASDEFLRHRMSDMSMTTSMAGSGSIPLGRSCSSNSNVSPPSTTNNGTAAMLSPLHSSNNHDGGCGNLPSPLSRRGSVVNLPPSSPLHHDYRRPSITELNSLPLPTASGSLSRRESVATIVSEYDYHTSRSPSPSSYKQPPFYQNQYQPPSTSDSDYHASSTQGSSYDPFHRRHSIATAEPSYPSTSSNRLVSKQRPFRFPVTIHESPNGTYSAPSSPPETVAPNMTDTYVNGNGVNDLGTAKHPRTHGMQHGDYHTSSSSHHPLSSQPQRLHYGHPYAGSFTRRRSILNDEDAPSLARRASMPVVTMGRAPTTGLLHQKLKGDPSYDSRYHDVNHSTSTTAADIDLDQDKPPLRRKSETPYSRSPELRVSHKLAERKRRKEMKELFDELRDSLPVEKNLKTSKWEILSKAVEYISALKRRDFEKENEVISLRHELAMMKRERSGHFGTLPY